MKGRANRRPASQAGKEGIAHGFQMQFTVLFYPPHSWPGKSHISYLRLFVLAIVCVLCDHLNNPMKVNTVNILQEREHI